ncbi:MAG: Gfo/Idh/MocA family oxidoreductase [Abitibacteriaceae bacterium]|nr:Gfo/Idh/MocA family oxidoreductase [Abditibacteriaceae bacterium]MBV9864552.1 Gfo/Idh/MocA family oxidoreductase [Abditibacteriaceae bacterium]
MPARFSRRRFLQNSALATSAYWLTRSEAFAQEITGPVSTAPKNNSTDKLNIGVIGVANRGGANLDGVSSQNIVALCDIDDNYLAAANKRFPQAKIYNDFRSLLDQKNIDAVVVSTPDHLHAPITLTALQMGKHVYCEKPLTHTVAEARRVAETARQHKRVTQMGIQIHSTSNYRRVVELIRSGAIGAVRESHVWSDRAWVGTENLTGTPPVPPNLHWDLWLGPAPYRPYNPAYLPANWRGWWEFGGGTLGDMACHHMDLSFWALGLQHPLTVEAEGPPVSPEITPAWLIVHYTFPARGAQPPVKLTWYQGGKRPALFDQGKLPKWGDGTLFIGDKGMLLADYDRRVLLPEADFKDFKAPAPTIPESIGHYNEWFEAIRNNGQTTCNFAYGGMLTETALLGNVAYRVGQKLEWDAQQLRATNCPAADHLLIPQYRKEWQATHPLTGSY